MTTVLGVIARRIRVTGIVQGVGFRPFVWRLAKELRLTGWVRNDAEGVEIAAQGSATQLAALLHRLRADAPALARVDAVRAEDMAPEGLMEFTITESVKGRATTAIPLPFRSAPPARRSIFKFPTGDSFLPSAPALVCEVEHIDASSAACSCQASLAPPGHRIRGSWNLRSVVV